MTATLCLLAFGAVMVYSASSPLGALSSGGSGAGEFVRYLVFGALGLAAMHVLSRRGLEIFTPKLVNGLLMVSFALLVLVLVPASAWSSTARGAGSPPGRSSSSPRS